MLFGHLVCSNLQLVIGNRQLVIGNRQLVFCIKHLHIGSSQPTGKDHMQKAYFVLTAWSVSIVFSFLKDWSVLTGWSV